MLGFSPFRYLLNIPGPLDIPACLCKGNFDDDVFNNQVPYLWLIYWWDIIYCGEERCMLNLLHLQLMFSELWCIKESLKHIQRDAKPVFTERQEQGDFTVITPVCLKCVLSFLCLTKLNQTLIFFISLQPLSSSSVKY